MTMTMTMIVVAALFSLVLGAVALRANARLRGEGRLPMQWWLNGEVTWSAPRAVALAFVPALALSVFVGVIVLNLTLRPRPGQEGLVLPTFIVMGVLLLAIQHLHLWLIEKTLRRDRN